MDRLTSNKKGISFKPILEIIGFLRYFMKKSQMDWMTGQRHVPRERESWRKLILFTLSGNSIHSEGKVYKFFLNLAGKVYTFPSDKKRITFLCGKLGKVNKFLIFHIRILYTFLILVNKNTFYIIQVAKAKALMNTTKILPQTTTELNLIEKNQHMKI